MEEYDPLKKYRNTSKLYREVKIYLLKRNVSRATPITNVAISINKCVKHFAHEKKPRLKVLYLCFKYLDEIEYPR
jgi:hypothetical protein